MRTIIAATLSLAGIALFAAAPANASAKWTCSGPEYVCGGAPQATARAKPASSQYKPAKAQKAVASYDASYDAPSKPKKKAATTSYSDSGSYTLTGKASYYWQPQALASGGRFNPNAMTAAHKTLPFGTKVRVTNQNNGQSVVVTINDRGPYIAGRIIDLSKAAAHSINMQGSGVVPVKVAVLGKG
ncbi:MAG: septal ring lytic transglycosylase RlpA family protein [Hyphomicrobium sp.]